MGQELALRPQLFDLPIEPGEVFLPNGIVRSELCQAGHYFLALPQEAARLWLVAGLAVHLSKLCIAHREIALPARIAGVRLREEFSNDEAVGIGF